MQKISSFFTPKIRRIIIAVSIAILIFFVLLFVFISPLAKYLIQKYDDKLLGRTIELSWVYINPLTGYVYLKNVRVYEENSDTVFFRADAISADFSMLKLFKKTYEISSLTVYRPWGHIIQNGKTINFQDIIKHFSPKNGTIEMNKERIRFSILDCTIKDGQFQYDEVTIPVTYFIKNVNVHSPGKWWHTDTMQFNVGFESGPSSGIVNGYLNINFKTLNYHFGGVVGTFDLNPLKQYMKVLSNYGSFGGILQTNVEGSGNFKSQFIRSKGRIAIDQFYFGPSVHEQYGSFQSLVLDIIDADPAGKKYLIDSVILDRPYFRYEMFDSLDNLSLMFRKEGYRPGVNDAQFNLILKIAEYLQDLLQNFVLSDFNINRLHVYKGNFVFNDFSLYEKFSIDAMPVHITGDSINKSRPRIKLASNAEVRPYGKIQLNASLDPKNLGTFDIDYVLDGVPVAIFNPYLVTHTSFALNRGTLELNGTWNVVDSVINSNNHLLIMNPQVTKHIKRNDTKRLPLPFLISLAKGPGGVIDYKIPVKGNLSNPEFKIRYVLRDVVRNIFVKPAISPYLTHVKQLEKTIDGMITLDWDIRQAMLSREEIKFVNTMVAFLKSNPQFVITISPLVYSAKEKEHIAYFEAKKKYFLSTRANGYKISEDDSLNIEEMSIKDASFLHYLNTQSRDSMMFSTEQKCLYLLGHDLIETRFKQLNKAREKAFMTKFIETGIAAQVKFTAVELGVPFNGFSRYKVNYNGDVPGKLQKAYQNMQHANQLTPRKKYEEKRWMPKIKSIKQK